MHYCMSEIIWDHWEYFWCVDLLCIKTIDCKLCMHWLFDSTDNYIETLHVVCGFLSHSLSYILKLWKHDISWKLHSIFLVSCLGPGAQLWMDDAIHWINHYPDLEVCFVNTLPQTVISTPFKDWDLLCSDWQCAN